jgi:hypothetical protein
LQGYDRAFGTTNVSESVFNDFMETVLFAIKQCQYKIDRTYEIQASQIFQTGIVTSAVNGNTDFKRKAASMVQYSAGIDWTIATVDPTDIIASGCKFLRATGKASGGVFDLYMGSKAYNAYVSNPIILTRSQKLWSVLTETAKPTPKDDGSVYMGQVSAGSYQLNIYTYPEVFTATTEVPNTSTPYIPDNMIVITPMKPIGIHGFGLVPMLPSKAGTNENNKFPTIESGAYVISEYLDMKRTAWEIHVKSAGEPLPLTVSEVVCVASPNVPTLLFTVASVAVTVFGPVADISPVSPEMYGPAGCFPLKVPQSV